MDGNPNPILHSSKENDFYVFLNLMVSLPFIATYTSMGKDETPPIHPKLKYSSNSKTTFFLSI